ncbi:MAG: acyl-CoA mutase large subunit family protein [Candidatus Hodarchaeales archaeon]
MDGQGEKKQQNNEYSTRISAKYSKWMKEKYEKAANRFPLRKDSFETISGKIVKPLYIPPDLDENGFDYSNKLGFPGEYPFTRGVQPTMYRGRLWTMRQYSGFGTAKETNERFKFLLEKGQTGLSVAFDLPTQIGYDSDDPIARGEVGKTGVAISSLLDMETLFAGIPLDKVSTSMTINAPAAVLLAMYIAVAEKQGVPAEKLRGTVQNDILKEYIARGTYIFPLEPSMRLITDLFAYCAKHLPLWNTISISGYHIREAGSTAAQEAAFTLANAVEYVKAAINAGLDANKFGRRLSFFFGSHNDVLEEVAKFRATRRLWASIMKNDFGVTEPKSMLLRFHAQTAGCSLTAQQPENNIVRVTLQTLAAVLGGTQSLHTNSMDEALALPTEKAALIALRTQQIVAHESGIVNTIDPLAGSYFIESLTGKIEEQVLEYFSKIKKAGGMLKAIETGYIQREIHESAFRYQREIEQGKRIIVGVNDYTSGEKLDFDILRIDQSIEQKQVEKLQELKETRDNDRVDKALKELENAARGNDSLFPLILEAVKVYATLGEICNTLRSVFGEYEPPSIF